MTGVEFTMGWLHDDSVVSLSPTSLDGTSHRDGGPPIRNSGRGAGRRRPIRRSTARCSWAYHHEEVHLTRSTRHRLSSEAGRGQAFDEAQLAAAAFLARYSGRTLDAYRHDLRGFFQWSA